jgi:cysteine desulfurase
MDPVVYFDNNATTRVAPEVFAAMELFLKDRYGNPSSIHRFGGDVGRALEDAREKVAALLGADPVEIVFASCGTESDNAAIRAALAARPERRHVVTTKVEHPAVLGMCEHLEKQGYRVTWLGVDGNGLLDLDELKDSISDETALASIMWANNETGVIFPISEIGEILKEKRVLFHVDAVQAAGKIPIDLRRVQVDFLTVSAHKFHGPKGVGALYVKRGISFRPFLLGGHQERNRRAGTENVPGIIGMGAAAELARGHLSEQGGVGQLRDLLEELLLRSCADCRVNGRRAERVANTSNVSFKFLEGEAILVLLDQQGICASTGSACTAGSVEPSHVLRAMGVPPDWIQGAVRFSLSRYNTEEEVRFVGDKMPSIVERLRRLSALGRLGGAQARTGGAGSRMGARR